MRRRTFCASVAAVGATLAAGWERNALACGSGSWDYEEEFLDLRPAEGGEREEVSHFFGNRLAVTSEERFHVADEGRVLAYLGPSAFHLQVGDARSHSIPAPNGGRIASSSTSPALAFQLHTLSPYDQVVVANPSTGAHQVWDDAYGAERLVSSPWGFVLGHQGPGSDGGRVSLLTGERRTRELARTEGVPTHVCASASRVAYFLGERAFTLDLETPDAPPHFRGRLPKPATAAALSGPDLVATTSDGAWLFRGAGAPRRLLTANEPSFLFARRGTIVVGHARGVWIHEGQSARTLEAPSANLHFVAPIEGSDDLLLCRGPSVFRYRARAHRLEKLGQGRAGMKLRGAALAGDRLLTWSSRTWRVTDSGCSSQPPPRAYLLD